MESQSSDAYEKTTAHMNNGSSTSIGDRIKSYPGMEEVESLMRSKFSSDSDLLSEIPEYLLSLGGKRIRPALTLVTSKLCGLKTLPQELIDVCAGIELIHMATLLHDDIIDRSPIRRGKPSPHIQFGESATLLTGDFLLVRAFSLCAHLDEFIVNETEEACVFLTEGEIFELPLPEKPCDLQGSLVIAEKKTAALFGLSAVSGAHIADAPIKAQLAMKSFGVELGIAFQILDDVLDVVADENLLGKKCGGDLIERKPSIVNVLWLDSGAELAKKVLLSEQPPADDLVQRALVEFREGSAAPVVTTARKLAEEKILKATQHLESAVSLLEEPDKEALGLLQALLAFTTSRLQ